MSVYAIFIVALFLFGAADALCTDGCRTPIGDLTVGRMIEVNSQCVDDMTCDGMMMTACENQSATMITDDDLNSFWVSERGFDLTLPVILQLDLESEMEFHNMTIYWKSFTPSSMVLERSSDYGNTWTTYRYWSTDCLNDFQLPPAMVDGIFQTQDAVCTSSQLSNESETQMTFSIFSHLPSNASYEVQQSYKIITNIRLNLTSTYYDDTNSSSCDRYFAISEWSIEGTCSCNGHAEECLPANGELPTNFTNKVYSGCNCQHRTIGDHCESCESGFNQRQWEPINECTICECYNHADDCDPVTGCINCTDNTDGRNCELCLPGYFANTSLLPMDKDYCAACGCNEAGAISKECNANGICSTCKNNVQGPKCSMCSDGYWNLSSTNVDGCQPCNGCGIGVQLVNNSSLPFCDKTNGGCICQNNYVIGEKCDQCEEGRYSLSTGCNQSCQCNLMGSLNASCNDSGQCFCKPNIAGTTCNTPKENYYFKSLDDIKIEGESAILSPGVLPYFPQMTESVTTEYFTGRGYALIPSNGGNVTFEFQVDISSQYLVLLRYNSTSVDVRSVLVTIESLSDVDEELNCNGFAHPNITTYSMSKSLSKSSKYDNFASLCFQNGTTYRLVLQYIPQINAATEWKLDSIIIMPDVEVTSPFIMMLTANNDYEMLINIDHCLPYSFPIIMDSTCSQAIFNLSVEFHGKVFECETPSLIGAVGGVCNVYGGDYECRDNFTGRLCDECSVGHFNYSDNCQPCPSSCNETGAVNVACDHNTGECQCKDGITGPTCDSCQIGYYNFTSSGCTKCNCSSFAMMSDCDNITGNCMCPPFVVGQFCDRCNDTYYSLNSLGCLPCDCHERGSLSQSCNDDGKCQCKNGATVPKCNSCNNGYYETTGSEQELCLSCFCFNHASSCEGDDMMYGITTVESDFGAMCGSYPSNCDDGWRLITADSQSHFTFNTSSGLGYTVFTNGDSEKFVAPSKYHGDYHLSYGRKITVSFVIGVNVQEQISDDSYIRINGSKFEKSLISKYTNPLITQENSNSVWKFTLPLNENYWKIDNSSGSTSTISQFVAVLTDITDIRLDTKLTQADIEFNYLRKFQIETVQSRSDESANETVESCHCDKGYTGQFCDQCDNGYNRLSCNPIDPCIPCECNNFTDSCSINGTCIGCSGNTTGDHCNECLIGYYDNNPPHLMCTECDCPNSLTGSCNKLSNGDIECTDCMTGFTGLRCDQCSEGYYGNASIGRCIDCVCNGNINLTDTSSCDKVDGICFNCTNNTEGVECQLCIDGYYGNARIGRCEKCSCNLNAVKHKEICERNTGRCFCNDENTSPDCSQCIEGYYGDPLSSITCLPCPCPTVLNTHSLTCNLSTDGVTPICTSCDEGYTGNNCEQCSNGYYGDAVNGTCKPCDCNGNIDPSLGSLTCNVTTGECLACLNNTKGVNCHECVNGYYGDVTNGISCQKCNCNSNGTNPANICDPINGTCLCIPKATGSDCGVCEDGYWGVSQGTGCVPCNCCLNGSSSTSCHQDTGHCYCLNNVGSINDTKCCDCSSGYYNLTDTGCKSCGCGELSNSIDCDDFGQCDCKEGGVGKKCDMCIEHFTGTAPNCTRCHDCYFIWSNTMGTITTNITFFMSRIERVLKSYEGHNVTTVQNSILSINEAINNTFNILNTIGIDMNLITNITNTLSQINQSYNSIFSEVEMLRKEMIQVHTVLNNAQIFMASVNNGNFFPNGMDVNDIYREIERLNNTIIMLETNAQKRYNELTNFQMDLLVVINVLEVLNANYTLAEDDILTAYNNSQAAANLTSTTGSFASNISIVMSKLSKIEKDIVPLESGAQDVNNSLNDVTDKFMNLDQDLNNLTIHLNMLSNMANNLFASLNSLKVSSDLNLQSVQNLMNDTNQALLDTQSLIAMINSAQNMVYSANDTLSNSNETASDILKIPTPSVENATNIAYSINSTIVSKEEIDQISKDANISLANATEILNIAQNASYQVQNLQNLINETQKNLSTIQNALTNAQRSFSNANESIETAWINLNKVNITLGLLPDTSSINSTLTSNLQDLIQKESQLNDSVNLAISNEMKSDQLRSDVTNANTTLNNAVHNVTHIEQETLRKEKETRSNETLVSNLQNKSEKLNNTANAVAIQQLKTLMEDYRSRLNEVQTVTQRIETLKNELKTMTAEFKTARDKYQRCYKTP
jgi:hypothetical protein